MKVLVERRLLGGRSLEPWRGLFALLSLAPIVVSPAYAEERASDDFDLAARASTNLRVFQADRFPGVAGSELEVRTTAPIHQSVSVHAARVDTPMGEDSLEMQVAAFGLLTAGGYEEQTTATWDVSSAFLRQRLGDARLAIGRMVFAGGAARYARIDGVEVGGSLPFGVDLSGYGGLTVLPRWHDRYGYHNLGEGYSDWASNPSPLPERSENAAGGARISWADTKYGSASVSFHHQSERQSIYQQNLGLSGGLTAFEPIDLGADLLYSIQSEKVAEGRVYVDWDAFRDEKSGTAIRLYGELLHSAPALLLSQASVFSVFTQSEVTEAGGELTAHLPARVRVGFSGYGQVYREGKAGARSELKARYSFDEKSQTMIRASVGRLLADQNGYVSARLAGRVDLPKNFYTSADLYFYFYDEEIRDYPRSSFYSLHLGYEPSTHLSTRVGASISSTPYAAPEARVLARLTYDWDNGRGGAW